MLEHTRMPTAMSQWEQARERWSDEHAHPHRPYGSPPNELKRDVAPARARIKINNDHLLPLVATVAPIVTTFQCRTHWAAKPGFTPLRAAGGPAAEGGKLRRPAGRSRPQNRQWEKFTQA